MFKKISRIMIIMLLTFSIAMPFGNANVMAAKYKYECTKCDKKFKTVGMAQLHAFYGFSNGFHTFRTIK